MLALIEDIERATNAGAYRSALALALTIPDICGQIAYPEIEGSGTRYRRWFNQYVKKYYKTDKMLAALGVKPFDAYACYKLRCAYLHSGNSRLQDVYYIKTLDFFIHKDGQKYLEDKGAALLNADTFQAYETHIRLNIAKLCAVLCMAGKEFYSDLSDKTRLDDFDINIYPESDELMDAED